MKAILVIDMPKNCTECQLKYLDMGDDAYFGGSAERCVIDGSEICLSGRYDDCPLKPLPTKITTATLSGQEQERTELFTSMALLKTYADGWNDCLKGITDD